ncbi:MAG: DegV family protein [Anaerolineales bacterium]|nr:DegV family protein [Anaerolineales bacterium]MCX7755019.1 DegV family protein [Anaerolineales bacterium]MDW8278736.1 DegV family protein [Anaerolineales bacterium]
MLRIVTDGAADMPREWKEQYDIQVVPINIHFGETTYLSDVNLDREGFYRLVDENKRVPKTSQPSPHQFAEFYKKIAQAGDTILSIHVTSKLSGTYASAVAAAQELAETFRIIPFDSMSGSAAIGILCREARLLERAGKSLEEILQHLEALRSRCGVILALDTLEYARMSGRVGTLQAALASMLNVKPIAVLKEGVLNMAEKVRTRKASLDRLLEMVKEYVGDREVMMSIVHARDPQAGADLMERARKMFNTRDLFLTDLSISVAANLGPGTVGIVFFPLE